MTSPWFQRALLLLAVMVLWRPVVFGQIRPSQPNVQSELHRAETAWRSGGSLLEAKVRTDKVLSASPDHVEALKLRAEVLLALERYDEAIRDAQRLTDLVPNDGRAYWILAESARMAGKEDLARNTLRTAAGLITYESPDLHVMLSHVAMALDELELAESFARVARAKDRTFAEAYYQLARVFVLQGQEDAAVTTLVGGLEEQVLDPEEIEQDATLQRVAGRHELATYLPQR